MHNVVDGLLVGLARQQKGGQHLFLQHLIIIHFFSHKQSKGLLQCRIGVNQVFGCGIAVVDFNAVCF